MSDSVKEIRDRVAALRCLIVGKSFTARDQDWLCDQLTRALDRNEAMEQALDEYDLVGRFERSLDSTHPAGNVAAAPEAR